MISSLGSSKFVTHTWVHLHFLNAKVKYTFLNPCFQTQKGEVWKDFTLILLWTKKTELNTTTKHYIHSIQSFVKKKKD